VVLSGLVLLRVALSIPEIGDTFELTVGRLVGHIAFDVVIALAGVVTGISLSARQSA
jgi:hypothetical protein